MSKIKVDIDRVNDLTPSFSQVATKVSNTTDNVASIRSQIDYRIKARHGIGDQLYKISNELQTIEKNMKKLVSFLQNSMDKYAAAEEKIARQVPMLPNVIGKNNITIDANGKIQVMDEYAQFNTNRAIDPNTGEYLFTYEGQRQVLGGNSSGTPDAISQLVNSVDDLLYEIFLSDIVTLFDPSASDSERAIARASMTPLGKAIKVIKGAKVAKDVLDNSEDIAKTVDKAENIKNLSKSVDKTKEIQDKTISDLEVKQLGEYIKDLEKKQVDKGTGEEYKNYKAVEYTGTTKVNGEERDISRRVFQRIDIDYKRIDPDTGMTNFQLMKKGRAPIWKDGTVIELHHLIQREPGSMVEIPASMHDEYNKILHGLVENGGSFRNDPVLKKQYDNFRSKYWRWRAKQIDKSEL
ncbi:HNH/ENDO VII family nuclease [Ureibacillus sp. FSL E2-3493]|uniref:HNH/ENDO VII family nuclease n=1 Tax=Ureibacillus sp. FSL E2-3493 TaxID=2921367 RepID=UPI0031197252